MSRVFFIADIHLTIADMDRRHLFSAFLDRCPAPGDRLYILGDLFDYWANNRFMYRSYGWVFERLQRLVGSGCQVGMLIGNRDFLLRKNMVQRYGIEYLGEESAVYLDGKQFFLSHGHLLCLEDRRFLRYRSRMWPVFRALDRLLPGYIENRLAATFQLKSKQVIEAQDPSRFRFTHSAIRERFRAGYDYVICGHTHQAEAFSEGTHLFYGISSFSEQSGAHLLYEAGSFTPASFKSP